MTVTPKKTLKSCPGQHFGRLPRQFISYGYLVRLRFLKTLMLKVHVTLSVQQLLEHQASRRTARKTPGSDLPNTHTT